VSSVSQIYFNKKCDQVTLEDIQKLIDENLTENYTLDYKAFTKKPQYGKYGKVISSFLNTNGGLLVIGVSEKDHKYPDKITWGTISRETLVQNLYNTIDPWSSDIGIKPIENPEDENERIFVVDVPKSKNPPYMANGVYYYRNVFESVPMTHSQVKAVFNETYLSKENILNYIIEPLYNDLCIILESNENRDYMSADVHSSILTKHRYLYTQIPSELKTKIDSFYHLIRTRKNLWYDLRNKYHECMRNNLFDKLEGVIIFEENINTTDALSVNVRFYENYRRISCSANLFECIIEQEEPIDNASRVFNHSNVEVIEYKLQLREGYQTIEPAIFEEIWHGIQSCIYESEIYTNWKDTYLSIIVLGQKLRILLEQY